MTVLTRDQLVALFADNTTHDISPADLRDFLDSAALLSEGELVAEFTLTDAQLRDLDATPILVIAAPADDEFIDIIGVTYTTDFNPTGGGYGLNSPPAIWCEGGLMPLVEVDFTADGVNHRGRHDSLPGGIQTSVAGRPCRIVMPGGTDMTGGNAANELRGRIYYRIEDAGGPAV